MNTIYASRGTRRLSFVVATAMHLVLASVALGQWTWVSPSQSGMWTDASNWSPSMVPPPFATVTFPGGSGSVVNLAGGPFFVGTLSDVGGGYTFLGGTLVFGGSATINAFSNNTNFLNGIGLEANATINTLAPNSTLMVSGTVTGGGASLTKTGQGTLILTTAASTFGGDIDVNGGTLTVQASTVSNPVGNTNVNGATLTILGGSTVSSVLGNTTVNFGGTLIVQDVSKMSSVLGNTTVNFGGTLTVQGNSTLSSANGNTNVNGGTMTIQGASTVSDANGAIAGAGGPLAGTVIVASASSWTNSSPVPNSGNLDVGQSGTGTLSIQNFSRVSNTGIGIIGDANGSTGSVTVTDFGSTWTSGSQIEVGSFGTGTLTIQNGGKVSDSVGAVGLHSGSTGTVTVVGFSSTWTNSGNLFVGGSQLGAGGAGLLQISNGGTVSAAATTIFNTGTLAIGSSLTLNSPLTINSGTVRTLANTTFQNGATIGAGNAIFDSNGFNSMFSGAFVGPGGITKISLGTVTLSGANAYTGGTTINAGTLNVSADKNLGGASSGLTFGGGTLQFGSAFSLAGTRPITLNGIGGGTIDTNGFDTTITQAITGVGRLSKTGAGTLTLTGANTYSLGTTIGAGTLQIGSGGSTGDIVGNVINSASLVFDRSDTVTFGGRISGTGSVQQNGKGTTTLSGANTYIGNTNVNVGTLLVNGSLGTGSVDVASGATLGGTGTMAGPVTIQNGGTLAPGDAPGTLTVATLTLNSGSILNYKLGTPNGVNDLVNVNGNLTLVGKLNIMDLGGFGSGVYRLFNYTGSLTNIGLTLNSLPNGFTPSDFLVQTTRPSEVNLLVSRSGFANQFWNGSFTSPDGTIHGGSGTWNNSATNWTNVDATVSAPWQSGFSIFAGATGTVALGDNIRIGGMQFMTGGYTITAPGSQALVGSPSTIIRVDQGISATIGAPIVDGSSPAAIIKTDLGTLILSGANAYTGGTTINAGTLNVRADNNLGGASGGLTFGGGTLQFGSAFNLTGTRAITLNAGGGTINTNGFSTTISQAITGAGGLSKTGAGTLTLTGTNTYAGGTTITAGTLQLGNGGSLVGDVLDNGSLVFDRADGLTFGGAISGTGTVQQNGTGTTTLSGANTYIGGTDFNAGILAVNSNSNLGTGVLRFNGGTLEALAAKGGIISGKAVTLNAGGGTFLAGAGTASTLSGAISGVGSLTKDGPGTLILSGASTYSGNTNVALGTLQAGSSTALSANSAFSVISLLDLHGFNNTISSVSGTGVVTNNGAGPATLTVGRSNTSATFSGTLTDGSDSLGFAKTGDGTVILTGGNKYTGGTSITAGTLQMGNGGTSGSIVGNVSDNATFAFDRSDSVTFGGVISGTGALVQMGSGTLTLTADNSYGGGTTINTGATLQLGNGGTTGGVVSNVTDNGSLIFGRSDNVTFDAIISGSGNLVQKGSGTTILGGTNTYSGGTIINNGTLLANNSQALGLGNVVVNAGVLGADPQPINVKGNYAQNAGGTLQLQVAGANPGQYDSLKVGRNAALGGTLQLISLGFQPKAGDLLTLVTTGGVVSSRFARFIDPFATGPGFNSVDLVYRRNSVLLEFLNIVPPVPPVITTINFASFALTPNQLAAANLLDAVQLDPRAANLNSFLDKEPFANLPRDFEKISPDGLTAFYEISFSNANIQRLTLEGRVDDIHNGSTGFSSNMKVNGATANLENKPGLNGESSKGVVEPILQPEPENRWGVWATGFGDFVNLEGDGNANGYDFTTGGVSLGVDYRITDQLAMGVMGEYSHTWSALNPSGHIDVDSGRGGLYATWYNHGIYLNGAIYGGHNNYDSSRSNLGELATGGTGGAEWSTFISGGYNFHFGPLSVGPIAALQYTCVNIDGFSEKSSLVPLQIHSGSAESLRSDMGFRVFYQWQSGKVLVEPSLKAAWEHEFKYSALPITAGFAGIPGPSATFFGPNEGHDSAVVSAGVSAQLTPAVSIYVNYDGQLGREHYDSNAVTGGVRISF